MEVVSEHSVGIKFNWEKVLHNPNINKSYRVGRYLYKTDELGRTVEASGSLQLGKADRNVYQQKIAAKSGGRDFQGGHLIASMFIGTGHRINLVPMRKKLNLGKWKKLEGFWKRRLNEGYQVRVCIRVIYLLDTKVPKQFEVTYDLVSQGNTIVKRCVYKN